MRKGFLLFCVALTAALTHAVEKPKLVLDAPRVQSIPAAMVARGYGKRVPVEARLEGEPENPEEYYCLDEVWIWGDGTESVHETDCDPYEEGTEIQRNFAEDHSYRPGRYTITLRLQRMEETVIQGKIDIRIY